MENKVTLVWGASLKPERYSNKAVNALLKNGFKAIAVGLRKGLIQDLEVLTGHPEIHNVHTISIYMRAERQKEHYDYLLELNPKRIIFNPGAENSELFKKAKGLGIEVENACTLVLLSMNQYFN